MRRSLLALLGGAVDHTSLVWLDSSRHPHVDHTSLVLHIVLLSTVQQTGGAGNLRVDELISPFPLPVRLVFLGPPPVQPAA